MRRRSLFFCAAVLGMLLAGPGPGCGGDGDSPASSSSGASSGDGGGGGGLFTTSASTGGAGGAGGSDPCPGDEQLCNGQCIPVIVDPNNCGGCGVTCQPNEVCLSNGCASECPLPLTACAGTCVDTDNDAAHCGGCGDACSSGQGCAAGQCQPAVPVGPPPAKCADGGPPIVIGVGPRPDCAGQIAGLFSYALCTCHDIGVPALTAKAHFDAFNSDLGPYVPDGLGGSVGANGSINMTATFTVFGDTRTSSGPGLTVGGDMEVHQALHVATNLELNNPLAVTLDAFVGGAISGNGNATIAAILHTPSCAAVPANVTSMACVDEAVVVPGACKCDPADLLPISAIVAHYAEPANNDNALIGLSPDVFASPGAPQVLMLPCGYYYLDRIDATTPITIAVHGHTALFVGGSIQNSANIAFTLDASSTLDVFVGGTMYATSKYTVGSPAFPAKTRFYVGGVCKPGGQACDLNADCCSLGCNNGVCQPGGNGPPFSVKLSAQSFLNGGFYAPFGSFYSSTALEMYGAIFTDYYHSSASTSIHYDGAFLQEGEDCPDDGCDDCSDCGNQACVAGECGPCTSDAQCCQPLYCIGGECVAVPR